MERHHDRESDETQHGSSTQQGQLNLEIAMVRRSATKMVVGIIILIGAAIGGALLLARDAEHDALADAAAVDMQKWDTHALEASGVLSEGNYET